MKNIKMHLSFLRLTHPTIFKKTYIHSNWVWGVYVYIYQFTHTYSPTVRAV